LANKRLELKVDILGMLKKHKYDIIVFFSLLGFGISVYLTTAHYLQAIVPCDITRGCEAVLQSKYSMLLGLPLSLWGIGFFVLVILSSLLANYYKNWKKVLTFLLGAGSIAALVFLSLQLFVLKKVCQYCLTVDVLIIILFLLDLNIEYKKSKGS